LLINLSLCESGKPLQKEVITMGDEIKIEPEEKSNEKEEEEKEKSLGTLG